MPTHLLLFQAIVVTLASFAILYMPTLSGAYWLLTALSAQMYLVMYLLLFAAAIRLRYTHPHIPRLYRIPHPHKGIWLVSLIGTASTLFALFISFVPPTGYDVGNRLIYESSLFISLIVMIAIPLIIYQRRKPSWIAKTES